MVMAKDIVRALATHDKTSNNRQVIWILGVDRKNIKRKIKRWHFKQQSLEENWVFVTNQFATSCDYLTFATVVGYVYNYFLHLVLLAITLWLTCD